ncbi:MAG: 4-hydroxy-3-methylbut-2-enyl diphosphate reductase [Treponema sp.]|nr:4-hydroxy-3-methylbut-2-enyl diphosphate reductase [Treponema sp.]
MTIIRARKLGFCSGVRQAVDLAYKEAARQGAVYTLGPLIHNPQVLDELKRRGVEILDERLPEDLSGATVIIRAHGVGPQTEAELRRRGATVVDATCPNVKSSQLKAAAFAKAGYRLFLAGEERHAEITGIRGYYEANVPVNAQNETAGTPRLTAAFCAVVCCAAQAEEAAAKLHAGEAFSGNDGPLEAKTALIGQTTISAEEYREIGDAITRFFPGLEIAGTICAATRERQDSLREITGKADAIIIVGGKKSANSCRLLAIAETSGKPCALVETAGDFPPEFLKLNSVGLVSGASTPDTVIDEIEQTILSLANSQYI